MSRLFPAVVVLGLLISAAVHAQTNMAGAWEMSINSPQGPLTAEVVLKQDKDQVTGTITAPQGSAELKGTVTGKNFALNFSMQGPNGPIDIKVTGEVDGNTCKGVLDFGGGQADFTGKKK